MIRLQDESGNWLHEVNINWEDEAICVTAVQCEVIDS